ncbi:MAG TPA: hypothetical protein VJH90_00815 [archaeon]|nr:hypothetical protein [archaeon]
MDYRGIDIQSLRQREMTLRYALVKIYMEREALRTEISSVKSRLAELCVGAVGNG